MNPWIVLGRKEGDDEDTLIIVQAQNHGDAVNKFKRELNELSGTIGPLYIIYALEFPSGTRMKFHRGPGGKKIDPKWQEM